MSLRQTEAQVHVKEREEQMDGFARHLPLKSCAKHATSRDPHAATYTLLESAGRHTRSSACATPIEKGSCEQCQPFLYAPL